MNKIDKQSRIPYYYQLADILRAFIRESLAANSTELLPSENALVQMYQVSRATVRQALSLLEREGLIYKAKGVGSYIAKHRVRYPLTTLISTTEEMKRRGWEPGIKVISFKTIETHPPITQALNLSESEKVYELFRLRLGNDQPVGLQWAYLPQKHCPGLIDLDLGTSLTRVMEDQFGIIFWSAHEVLQARLPTAHETHLLDIPADLPVLFMERITYSTEAAAVEFLQSVWRSDCYEYEFSLTRTNH